MKVLVISDTDGERPTQVVSVGGGEVGLWAAQRFYSRDLREYHKFEDSLGTPRTRGTVVHEASLADIQRWFNGTWRIELVETEDIKTALKSWGLFYALPAPTLIR